MRMPEDLELEKLTAVAHRSVTMPTRQRRSERSSDSPRFEYSPGSMFSPAPGDLRILWRRPPWGRCVPHPTRVQLAPTRTHGTTRHHAPALPTSTSVAHSTPPDPGSPVVSHSLAHMASQGCSAPTRSARPVTCKDRPHGIYPPPNVRSADRHHTGRPYGYPAWPRRMHPPPRLPAGQLRPPRMPGLCTTSSRTIRWLRSRMPGRCPTRHIRPLSPRPTGQLQTHPPGSCRFSLRPPDH